MYLPEARMLAWFMFFPSFSYAEIFVVEVSRVVEIPGIAVDHRHNPIFDPAEIVYLRPVVSAELFERVVPLVNEKDDRGMIAVKFAYRFDQSLSTRNEVRIDTRCETYPIERFFDGWQMLF